MHVCCRWQAPKVRVTMWLQLVDTLEAGAGEDSNKCTCPTDACSPTSMLAWKWCTGSSLPQAPMHTFTHNHSLEDHASNATHELQESDSPVDCPGGVKSCKK